MARIISLRRAVEPADVDIVVVSAAAAVLLGLAPSLFETDLIVLELLSGACELLACSTAAAALGTGVWMDNVGSCCCCCFVGSAAAAAATTAIV